MPKLKERITAFSEMGNALSLICGSENPEKNIPKDYMDKLEAIHGLIQDVHFYNGWFTEGMVRYMICSVASVLNKDSLKNWLKAYPLESMENEKPKTIGVVMAGNVPLVGFHDFLTVLMSGNRLKIKLSSDDNKLLPAIYDLLLQIEPQFQDFVVFTNGKLGAFDAVIATGSNNSARYFDYYFGKYPHIIRKNRNGVAVLTGKESEDELKKLTDDIFLYYGLGCRNVSKIYVPEGYDFTLLKKVLEERKEISENHKYFNNYEYNKAIYLVNGTSHIDCTNLMLVENEQIASPVSVLYYAYYESIPLLTASLSSLKEDIQCIVSHEAFLQDVIPFGESQKPGLGDYADGVDTLQFLLSLDKA
ncbi:MAG: acyl-CoA reductase [bacterium]